MLILIDNRLEIKMNGKFIDNHGEVNILQLNKLQIKKHKERNPANHGLITKDIELDRVTLKTPRYANLQKKNEPNLSEKIELIKSKQ